MDAAGTSSPASARDQTRERIVVAAGELLRAGGQDAVSTRAVSAAAGVQAPTLYRLFGDKRGLLDAVAEHGLRTYLERKVRRRPDGDPVDDLRAGWDLHVSFGLENPALYALMYAESTSGATSAAAAAAASVLALHVRRIAEAGRLRVGEEHAAHLIHAAGRGTTLTLISMPDAHRDLSLSHTAREAVLAAITTDVPTAADPGPVPAAVAMRAVLPRATALTLRERELLAEWLDRVIATPLAEEAVPTGE